MTWGMVAVAGATVVGGVMASNSAGNAADAQSSAADQANATQRAQAAQARNDNMPWMNRGNQAGDRLGYLMGITPPGSSRLAMNGSTSYDPSKPFSNAAANAEVDRLSMGGDRERATQQVLAGWGAQFAPVAQGGNQLAGAPSDDPAYGSLTRKFSQADMNADPVYQNGLQFGLDQGVQGINRQAASRGGLNSGATLKALTRFSSDYGSTKANESYNRFTNDQSSTFNKLSGISGTGQVANAQINASGQNMANNVSQNQIGAGNARASSYIAQGNALTGMVNQGANAFNQYNALNGQNNFTGANASGYYGSQNQAGASAMYGGDGMLMSMNGGT